MNHARLRKISLDGRFFVSLTGGDADPGGSLVRSVDRPRAPSFANSPEVARDTASGTSSDGLICTPLTKRPTLGLLFTEDTFPILS